MKKFLTVLLVALLAASSAFAGVTFSGDLAAGYVFNWNTDKAFHAYKYGQDGVLTDMVKLNLKAADDNGLWNATIQGNLKTDSSGAVDGTITLDAAKIFSLFASW